MFTVFGIDLFLDQSFAHIDHATEVTLMSIPPSLKQILAELCG